MALPEILSASIQTLRAHTVTISWGRKINIDKSLCSLHVHIFDTETRISDSGALAERPSLQLLLGECRCVQQTSKFKR